jgi:hypothetical protein
MLFLNCAPCHDGVLGSGGISLRILDLGTRWEWSASRSGRFTPRERAAGTHWIGGWVGPRAVLDAAVKRKIPRPRRESNPRTWQAGSRVKLNYITLFQHEVDLSNRRKERKKYEL